MKTSSRLHIADAGIRLDSMPNDGRNLKLVVDAEDRAAIATFLEILAIEALGVNLVAVRFKGGIRVTGKLEARVVQPSVVSLEPVEQTIAEPIDRIFLPTGDKHFADDADADVFVDPGGEDIPDHFEGNEADLTDLIVETVALALDPYPRLAGESVSGILGDASVDEHPFAALKALKTRDDGA